MEGAVHSGRLTAGRGQKVESDLEAGMKNRINKADGKESENGVIGGVQNERGIEQGTVVKSGASARQGVENQGLEREAHAGIKTIDSIDWVKLSKNPRRNKIKTQPIPMSPMQTLLKNFLKP